MFFFLHIVFFLLPALSLHIFSPTKYQQNLLIQDLFLFLLLFLDLTAFVLLGLLCLGAAFIHATSIINWITLAVLLLLLTACCSFWLSGQCSPGLFWKINFAISVPASRRQSLNILHCALTTPSSTR